MVDYRHADNPTPFSKYKRTKKQLIVAKVALPYHDLKATLERFPRKMLREAARCNGVKIGKDKADTIENLIEAGVPVSVSIDMLELWNRNFL